MRRPLSALPATLLVAFLAALPSGDAAAAESFDSCSHFIDALPVTIETGGTWCVRADLEFAIDLSDVAVRVLADDVIVDCNGHRVTGVDSQYGPANFGIYATGDGFTLRQCTLAGFINPVSVEGDGILVEDNVVAGAVGRGIHLNATNATIRRNHVRDVAGAEIGGSVHGISAFGTADIIDNTVAGVRAREGTGDRAFGIYLGWLDAPAETHVVTGNRIRDVAGDGDGLSAGIAVYTEAKAVVRRNVIVVPEAERGIYCSYWTTATRVSENVVLGGTASPPVYVCPESTGNVEKN